MDADTALTGLMDTLLPGGAGFPPAWDTGMAALAALTARGARPDGAPAWQEAAARLAVTDFLEGGIYRTPAWHMLGTCRMGADPETSVVDRWHRSWEVPNPYVCDGSSFATGGAVNPTSTLTALALRCARRIVAERARSP